LPQTIAAFQVEEKTRAHLKVKFYFLLPLKIEQCGRENQEIAAQDIITILNIPLQCNLLFQLLDSRNSFAELSSVRLISWLQMQRLLL
jgi:hypothetical protein